MRKPTATASAACCASTASSSLRVLHSAASSEAAESCQVPINCNDRHTGRHLPPLIGSVSLAVAALRLHCRSQHYCITPSIQSISDTRDSISPRLLQLQSILICLLQLLFHFFQLRLDFRDLSSHNQSKPARSIIYMHRTSRSRISSSLATISIWSCSACACATCPNAPVTLDVGRWVTAVP